MNYSGTSDGIRAEETASRFEKNLAINALNNGDCKSAWHHLKQTLSRLCISPVSSERDAMLVETSLQLVKLSFALGKGFGELTRILENALQAACRIGDRRSRAMINLHLGRLFYFGEQRRKAIDFFSRGKSEVESLGDADINEQAAELIGLFYFIQGDFQRAIDYFESALTHFETTGRAHLGPMWLSYCSAYLGQFHRAIGTLDYYRRLARQRADHSLATTLRAVLGIILVSIKKNREAAYHLSGSLQEALQQKNAMASYFAKGGLSYHHMLEGRLEDAASWMAQASAEGARVGLIRQYASPIVIETIYAFHRHGLDSIPEFSFRQEMQRLMREPNIHLHGVVLRLKAMDAIERGEDPDRIQSDLKKSERLLKRSGDPVQLAKTRIEMARLNLKNRDVAAARILAQKAWKGFSGYADVFYPDDLRHLLTAVSVSATSEPGEDLFELFSTMIQELVPSADLTELLHRAVKATNRFFGAERGGIFWFRDKNHKLAPELRAGCNLFEADIATEAFRPSLSLIFKACRQKRPLAVRKSPDGFPGHIKAMIAIPFQIRERVRGVLYHDNSYVDDCFEHFDNLQLARMARSLTRCIDQIAGFTRHLEQKKDRHLSLIGRYDEKEIIYRSAQMGRVLEQTDRIAGTKSTVLILGETGVGKELLARRIHYRSPRRNRPMIIVDPTTIPETLVENELFGHEKGAFTGADRQKPGRLELAHKGTLFIDEVGEIPLPVQVKLLRALQEKTLTRVGGTATISSDFRLIAATHRNLAEDVAEGRFREDLYYRLNVIPIVLPPLRERPDDILLLARHFLKRYAGKYQRHDIRLSGKDEKALMAYAWPGNIRELKNIMERAVLLSSGEVLDLSLPTNRRRSYRHLFRKFPTLDEVQRRYIQHVLEQTGGKIAGPDGAAEILGMKRTSLYKRMKKLGLR